MNGLLSVSQVLARLNITHEELFVIVANYKLVKRVRVDIPDFGPRYFFRLKDIETLERMAA